VCSSPALYASPSSSALKSASNVVPQRTQADSYESNDIRSMRFAPSQFPATHSHARTHRGTHRHKQTAACAYASTHSFTEQQQQQPVDIRGGSSSSSTTHTYAANDIRSFHFVPTPSTHSPTRTLPQNQQQAYGSKQTRAPLTSTAHSVTATSGPLTVSRPGNTSISAADSAVPTVSISLPQRTASTNSAAARPSIHE
jgi:hypothetical protein